MFSSESNIEVTQELIIMLINEKESFFLTKCAAYGSRGLVGVHGNTTMTLAV